MDWLDPNTWKTPAELIGYWKTIFSGGSYLLKPLRWLRSGFKGKARQKSISFVSNDRLCNWSEAKLKDEPATYIQGRWHVTNTTESDVMILKARLAKYATPFAYLRTRNPDDERQVFGDYPVLSHHISEVSADFTFFPPIARTPKPIIDDVIFTDNFANEHRVRTTFSYIGLHPMPSASLRSRWFRR